MVAKGKLTAVAVARWAGGAGDPPGPTGCPLVGVIGLNESIFESASENV